MAGNTKKAVILALFLVVISLSGCLGATQCPDVASQTEGLAITRFQTSYNEVPVGDHIMLQMDIQNRGMNYAEDVTATLWSHSGFTILSNETVSVNAGKPLAPPDISICSPGDALTVVWQLRANCDPTSSTLSVYLDYTFASDGWATLLLASQDEVTRSGGILQESGENYPSAGPIQVQIQALQTEPIIISPYTQTFDARVLFKNSDQGLVGRHGNGNIRKVTLELQGPCVFNEAKNTGYVNGNKLIWENEVTLSAGKQEALKLAYLEYQGTVSDLVRDYCRINVHAEYDYRVIKATDKGVGVTGTAEQVALCREAYASEARPITSDNKPPVADIGRGDFTQHDDPTIINFNAGNSYDADGFIVSYFWEDNGIPLSTSSAFSKTLGVGKHVITLSVTDNNGRSGTDTVTIQIGSDFEYLYETITDYGYRVEYDYNGITYYVHAFDEDAIVKDHTEKMDILIKALEEDGVKFGDKADAGEVLDAIESRGIDEDSKWFGVARSFETVTLSMPRLDNGHYVYKAHIYEGGEIDQCMYLWNYKNDLMAIFFTCAYDAEPNVLVETATSKYPPSSGGGIF